MPNYYLDIETTSPDPRVGKIISIQFAELDRTTATQKGELSILREWNSSEKQILLEFISRCGVADRYPFTFVSVGFNLIFERQFILHRCIANGLIGIDILKKPHIDLRHIAVIMNRGKFLGSGLDKITQKPHTGSIIPVWYQEKKWREIEKYIEAEADEFIRFSSWLYRELPVLREKYRNGI